MRNSKMPKLIVDGDSLAYVAGSRAQKEIEGIEPMEEATPTKGLPAGVIDATQAAKQGLANRYTQAMIDKLVSTCSAHETDLTIHLTYSKPLDKTFRKFYGRDPVSCFRYKESEALPKMYKHNRKAKPETLWAECLQYLAAESDWYTEIHDFVEADDVVVYEKNRDPDAILCSIDKDVLNQAAGYHYNYGKDEWVDTTEQTTIFYLFYQCIIGDSGDGYGGVPRIGPKKALQYIHENMSRDELFKATEELYRRHGIADQFLPTLRIASVQSLRAWLDGVYLVDYMHRADHTTILSNNDASYPQS